MLRVDLDKDEMNLRTLTTAALLTTALAVAGGGTGQADPGAPAPKATDVHYTAQRVNNTVVVTLEKGAFEVARDVKQVAGPGGKQVKKDVNVVAVKTKAGAVAEKLPLSYRLHGNEFPIDQKISADKHTLTLTPQVKPEEVAWAHLYNSVGNLAKPNTTMQQHLKPIASSQENELAQNNFTSQLGMATTVGSLVGTAIGAVLGFGLGIVAAGAACVLSVITAFIGCLIAVLPILATAAAVGGIAGTVLAGGGTAVSAGWDYLQTMQAAPGTTHYQVDIDQRTADQARAQAQMQRNGHR